MSIRASLKWSTSMVGLLLVAAVVLVGCGSAPTSNASASASGASNQAAPAPKVGGKGKAATGTIDSFDAAKKMLSIKEADGSVQTFAADKARIVKDQKITTDQLSTLLGTTGIVVNVTGQQGSDGTYTAQSLVLADGKAAGGNANGTPNGVKASATPNANGTPRAGGRRLVLSNAKFQNNQLTGTDQAGKVVTVVLSSTTTMAQESAGTTDDLKSGEQVRITLRGAQKSSTDEAGVILVGDALQAPAN